MDSLHQAQEPNAAVETESQSPAESATVALIEQGDALLRACRPFEAVHPLTAALSQPLADGALRARLARCFAVLSTYFAAVGNFEQQLNGIRIACSLDPMHGDWRINFHNVLAKTKQPARLLDYTNEFLESELGTHIFITCFPKSGSSFLKNTLVAATGFPERFMTYAFLQNEQELYLPHLLSMARENTVTQQHTRATEPNLHLMQAFGIRPVILVRNIFDVLLSWKEFLDAGAHTNTHYAAYPELSEVQRMDLVIDDRAAWYLSFFAGWQRAMREGRIEAYWLSYRQLMGDKSGRLREILDFYGIERTPAEIDASLAHRNSAKDRFNKGVVGRGVAAFTETQKGRVRRIAACHPDIDFSLIGL